MRYNKRFSKSLKRYYRELYLEDYEGKCVGYSLELEKKLFGFHIGWKNVLEKMQNTGLVINSKAVFFYVKKDARDFKKYWITNNSFIIGDVLRLIIKTEKEMPGYLKNLLK